MPEKLITSDPPLPQDDDFEEYLATDDLFVDFFNHFLELPSFPEPLRFNPLTGGFEVVTPVKNQLAEKIKALSRAKRPKSSIYKNALANPPVRLPHYENEEEDEEDEVKTSFNVKCLDKEQGTEWIKEHRLPKFLSSDLFIEYRLAKLLSQIETNKTGMKLTISPSYRPWHKEKPVIPSDSPIDETKELMQRLQVSVGAMSTTQTKEWFSVAKQLEDSLASTSNASSRPTSSISDGALRFQPKPGREQKRETPHASRASVTFAGTSSEEEESNKTDSARIVPYHIKSSTQMGHVVKIEPQPSDDESDQGVGSECGEASEELTLNKQTSSGHVLFEEDDDIESYANRLVSLIIERAIHSLTTSSANSKETEKLSHKQDAKGTTTPLLSRRSTRISTTTSEGPDAKSATTFKKSIAFSKSTEVQFEDEADSVFSDETDETDSIISLRPQEFTSVKGFNKFRSFLKDTVGEKLASLWMDIDRSRFSISQQKLPSFLHRVRDAYLKVGSTKRLPNEILNKYKLMHATNWTVEHLQSVQQEIAEPLLLYWTPRFLVRLLNNSSKEGQSPRNLTARSRDLRPTSSQSYPSPKTITILPLRPRSCLPRIKQGQRPSQKLGHVVSEYHQFTNPDLYLKSYEPPVLHDTPSPIPSYLKSKVSNLTSEFSNCETLLPKRPATAGPLTRQTKARFERRKSAAARSRVPATVRTPRVKISPPSSVSSESSVRGSPAMESMLQALYHDTRAGWFFTQFCENSKNKMWSNSIHFWFDVQEYHHLFYQDMKLLFHVFTACLEDYEEMIYSTYIVNGSSDDIGLSSFVRKNIRSVLQPPFDELFDMAEEYVLKLLIVPWNRMLGIDKDSYSRVELIEQERRLNVAAKYMDGLQRKGILKDKKSSMLSSYESEKKHEDDLWSKVPEEFHNFTFDDLIRNRIELEHFRKFLDQNYVKTDLMCWLDMETFKRLPHHADQKRDEKAKEIREKYLNKKYFFGPSSPATKDEQNEAVKAGGGWGKTLKERPPTQLIVEAQKYVRARIENRWLPLFLATKDFQDRQRPKSQMSDVAEDVALQRRKKRGEPWKLLDNRWQSSSRDLVEFRRALNNPVTAGQFRRYVSINGEHLENDVLFWLEVQKYKDFCHIHNDSSAIEGKVTSIINCFISSHIPPALQIDISHEMAEKLMEKRKELGPYVFREAQLTVFRVLFPYWSKFCDFRKTLSDEKLTTRLERERKAKMKKTKQKMKEQEQDEARKEELKASKESDAFDLPDVVSLKGSDLGESLFAAPRTQVSWSYGKYIEGLDKQKMLLLMENEVKGRIPLEALANPDYDVATENSEDGSDSEDVNSARTGDGSNTSRKKKKDKIIHSTVRTPPASEVVSLQNGTEGKPNVKQHNKTVPHQKTGNGGPTSPAVIVD